MLEQREGAAALEAPGAVAAVDAADQTREPGRQLRQRLDRPRHVVGRGLRVGGRARDQAERARAEVDGELELTAGDANDPDKEVVVIDPITNFLGVSNLAGVKQMLMRIIEKQFALRISK